MGKPYREVRAHNVEAGTVIVFRHDPDNPASKEEANAVVDEIKKANPHWEGPFLVMPTDHALESMPEVMARELYVKLKKIFETKDDKSEEVADAS